MSFVSYSQNYEDVRLWRALGHIERGCYLDIGAQHPVTDSVSKLFYDAGWRGAHVEPTAAYAEALRAARPDEPVFEEVVGRRGPILFYEFPETGISTGVAEIARMHSEAGFVVRLREVPAVPLSKLFADFGQETIHWMKIDVEGMEKDVIDSWDRESVKPWVLVIESVHPSTREPTQDQWIDMVLARGYQEAAFDGLSRFFVAEEHADLAAALTLPPNIFDEFRVTRNHFSAQSVVAEAAEELNTAQQLTAELERVRASLETSISATAQQLSQREADLAEANTQIVLRDEGLRHTEAQLAEARAAMAALDARVSATEQQLSVREADLANAYAEIARGEEALRGTDARLAETQAAVAALEQEVASKEAALREAHALIRGVVSEQPGLWLRIGEAIGLARRSSAWNALATWADSVPSHPTLGIAQSEPNDASFCVTDARPKTVDELLNLHGDDFVRGAYRLLMNREADASGLRHYTGRLRDGTSRLRVLSDLVRSPEGRKINARVPGLRRALGRQFAVDLLLLRPINIALFGADRGEKARPRTIENRFDALDRRSAPLAPNVDTESALSDEPPASQEFPGGRKPSRGAAGLPTLGNVHNTEGPASSARPKCIAYSVGHMCNSPDNPGVQNVTRQLARALIGNCQRLILVKWNDDEREFQVLTREELGHLGNWKHPATQEILNLDEYPARTAEPVFLKDVDWLAFEWMVLPEVPYLGTEDHEITINQINAARALNLKTAVLFHDAMPLRRAELKPMAALHEAYMRQLMEADLIFPISDDSSRDLDLFFRSYEGLDPERFPLIKRVPLPEDVPEVVTADLGAWAHYADVLASHMENAARGADLLGPIYCIAEQTAELPGNGGFQRVTRGLARALLEIGTPLIAAKWNSTRTGLEPLNDFELKQLARSNGPKTSSWSQWVEPGVSAKTGWVLMCEPTPHFGPSDYDSIRSFMDSNGLRGACIFHDIGPWKMKGQYSEATAIAHANYMRGINTFQRIFPNSEYSGEELRKFYLAERERTIDLAHRVSPCVLPCELPGRDRAVAPMHSDSNSLTIFSVGPLEARNNHLTLVKAFLKAQAVIKGDVRLVLAGDAPDPAVRAQIKECMKSSDSIEWVDRPTDKKLDQLYRECDFTVHPCIEEGFALPILESSWYGKPCISSSFGAMREAAEGGGCLLVDTTDVDALASAIVRLGNNRYLRLALAQEACERPTKTWTDYAAGILDKLVADTPRPGPAGSETRRGIISDEWKESFSNLSPRPLLSICITTYNRAAWLKRSLKALLEACGASEESVEVVVCDNASTDATTEVMRTFGDTKLIHYYRNTRNVGMLGNLLVTSQKARGEYIWIIGDDDLVLPDGVRNVLKAVKDNRGAALVYMNYAYAREENPAKADNLREFFATATPIADGGKSFVGLTKEVAVRNENFFTAIYCIVFRRDHGLRAYGQHTGGKPFSSLPTCVPTTNYILKNIMDDKAVWLAEPQLVVNLNVSWMKYAWRWILERFPEIHDTAVRHGANPGQVDRWREHHLPNMVHYFGDALGSAEGGRSEFEPATLMLDIKHLERYPEFRDEFRQIYSEAFVAEHPAARHAPDELFAV